MRLELGLTKDNWKRVALPLRALAHKGVKSQRDAVLAVDGMIRVYSREVARDLHGLLPRNREKECEEAIFARISGRATALEIRRSLEAAVIISKIGHLSAVRYGDEVFSAVASFFETDYTRILREVLSAHDIVNASIIPGIKCGKGCRFGRVVTMPVASILACPPWAFSNCECKLAIDIPSKP